MKLAKYLADYLDHEKTCGAYGVTGDVGDLEDTIQQGLEAFTATELVVIEITSAGSTTVVEKFE